MTDDLEFRSADDRAADLATALPAQLRRAQALGGNTGLSDVDVERITDPAALSRLPVTRKADLAAAQAASPPLGGYAADLGAFTHLFQSPGPIYEP